MKGVVIMIIKEKNIITFIHDNGQIAGKCAIVFVRDKMAPNVSYITCEIGTDGIIRQYLESYNTQPSPLAHEFYKKYQDFLSSKKAEINKMLLC